MDGTCFTCVPGYKGSMCNRGKYHYVNSAEVDNSFPGVSISTVTHLSGHYLFYYTDCLISKGNFTADVNSTANRRHNLRASNSWFGYPLLRVLLTLSVVTHETTIIYSIFTEKGKTNYNDYIDKLQVACACYFTLFKVFNISSVI